MKKFFVKMASAFVAMLVCGATHAATPAVIPGDILMEHITGSSGVSVHENPLFDYAREENGYILFQVKPTYTDTYVFTANVATGNQADRYCSLGPVDGSGQFVGEVVEQTVPAGASGSNWQPSALDLQWSYDLVEGETYTFKFTYRKNGQSYGVNLYTLNAVAKNHVPVVKQVLAFPGAEGFGRYTTGGRGGKVYHVTTLDDSGPGSLREAVEASGKRTVVFDVAGIIELKSALKISNGNITIAGQTAPGSGICLKNYSLHVDADNVIIRFIRSRMGDEAKVEGDAAWGRYHKDIIIDHCSFSWCVDECASFYSNENFTMQWCMINESLNQSVHGKGNHGYGGLWGGKPATFHHNFISSHMSRTPRFTGGDPATEMVDFRNNVMYNWGPSLGCYGATGGNYNMVNNYYKPGPATATKQGVCNRICYTGASDTDDHYWGIFHLKGNYFDTSAPSMTSKIKTLCNQVNANNMVGLHLNESTTQYLPSTGKAGIVSDTAFACPEVTTHTAAVAFEKVMELAGASYRRDVVDARYVEEARTGSYTFSGTYSKNGIIDTQGDVGGWPTYGCTTAERLYLTDTDGDGMPDSYEDLNGLDMSKADGDQYTLHADYTNLEVYMNSLVSSIMEAGMKDSASGMEEQLERSYDIDCNGNQLTAEGAVGVMVYSTDGVLLQEVSGDCADFTNLERGIYLVRIVYDGDIVMRKILR